MNGKVFLRELYFAGKQYLSTLSKNDILFVKWNVNACFFDEMFTMYLKKKKGNLCLFISPDLQFYSIYCK